MLEGRYVALNENDPDVLAFARAQNGHTVIVALNMGEVNQNTKLDLSENRLRGSMAKTLLDSSALRVT